MALVLAACAETKNRPLNTAFVDLPDAVVAMAAPNQDLTSARVLPEDGCFWYLHVNPVETTLLPLRNIEGRPICTERQT